MLSQPQNPPLPRGSIGFALGIAGMLVSLYFSIEFITGNATGADLIAGIVFCLILDYGKVALATEAMLAMASFRLLAASCYSLIVISLYCLSMLAATFMLTSHNTSAKVDQADNRIASLQQQISDKKAELSQCNSSYLTRCINPRTKELTDLQNELSAAQSLEKDVLEAKDRAATWEKLAKTVGSTPEELQVKLSFARAVLLEIIAPIFVSLFLSAYRNKLPGNEKIINPELITSNQLPTRQDIVTRHNSQEQTKQPIQPQTAQPLPSYKVTGLKW